MRARRRGLLRSRAPVRVRGSRSAAGSAGDEQHEGDAERVGERRGQRGRDRVARGRRQGRERVDAAEVREFGADLAL